MASDSNADKPQNEPGRAGGLPAPSSSGIDFIVLATMENRSFDHFLSWVPGAEGMPANQQFKDAFGAVQTPFLLSANPSYGYQACSYQDPNHGY
ncbi:phospholipase C [Paraburkholderia fungorum]|jgi:phospholipase C|uniref:Phospholipase C n=1 Tax=Paraburkholderia fungorum TaxID=134537 RepID=A0AAW3URE8_9BURK|nr:phospholipase C [Paraburkholderia fungorum]MBB6201193.1 phospholipase C [Paraburkholderia fungorum]